MNRASTVRTSKRDLMVFDKKYLSPNTMTKSTLPSESSPTLQYNKLIPFFYTTSDGLLRTSLLSFHHAEGTLSLVTFQDGSGDSNVIVQPQPHYLSPSSSSSSMSTIACSPDGQRVIVGYKDGSTRIYSFTADQLLNRNDNESNLHPFFSSPSTEEYAAGPRFQSPVRDLAFDPRSSSSTGYFLAIASEDHDCGVCVVNLSDDLSERYLLDSSSSYGGVRSIAYTPTIENDTVLLAALGMDGKLTVYTCMGLDQPDVYWDVLLHETVPVVSKKDIGELARVVQQEDTLSKENHPMWDNVVAPVWSADGSVLALPGSTDVQLRLRGDVTKKYYLYSSAVKQEGHVMGEIVACALDAEGEVLVSVGRDGTACVWSLDKEVVRQLVQDPSLDKVS